MFANTVLLLHGQITIRMIGLAFLLVVVNVPALIYTLQSDIYVLTRRTYGIMLGLTIGADAILHITFYFCIYSALMIPHCILSLILDFLIFFFRKKAKTHETTPNFETGRCRVPVVVNSKLILHKAESVRVLRERNGMLLVRKLNGEEHYVDANLIEEENDSIT